MMMLEAALGGYSMKTRTEKRTGRRATQDGQC
jgi:hypothetical protein